MKRGGRFHPLKWRLRVLLSRLGLWDRVEVARLLARMRLSKSHEEEFRIFAKFGERDGLFVDIGANIGQSAVSFRTFNRTFRILSFEPNPGLATRLVLLKPYLGENFEVSCVGIGETRANVRMYVPVIEGCPLTQEGTIFREELRDDPLVKERVRETTGQTAFDVAEYDLSIHPLDEYGLDPDVVKLDIQGAELSALKGMTETLKRSQPILLIENGKEMKAIRSFLAAHGYNGAFVYDRHAGALRSLGAGDVALNLFFVSEAKVPDFISRGWISAD